MTVKGIPLCNHMVLATNDGRKNQTRRVLKLPDSVPLASATEVRHLERFGWFWQVRCGSYNVWKEVKVPYKPGDVLYVREAWRAPDCLDSLSPSGIGEASLGAGYQAPWSPMFYEADGAFSDKSVWHGFGSRPGTAQPGRYRHARFMPRWASRTTLEVTEVRVERLQDISPEDAIAEGLAGITKDGKLVKYGLPDLDGLPGTDNIGWPWDEWRISPVDAYEKLWVHLHGQESWDENPWVIVICFVTHLKNVSALLKEKLAA